MMTKTSRFLSKFGAVVLCAMMLNGCSAKDMEISNSFFPDGVEAHDAQVAQWKFERAERIRIREEQKAREKAEREAAKQARLAKKQEKIDEFNAEMSGETGAQVQSVESVSLTTGGQPVPMTAQDMQAEPMQDQAVVTDGSMIPMDNTAAADSTMAPMPGEEPGMYADETMSPMPVNDTAGPMDLTAPAEAAPAPPADALQNEGSITREEFERLMQEKQMQQQYMQMREDQLTLHPMLIMGESSESSTIVVKSAGAPMVMEAENPDLPPAVEVYPVWEEGRAESPGIYTPGQTATQESVTVFPLDGPYDGQMPVLDTGTFDDSPGWGKVQIVNTKSATSGLTQPGVSYTRPVSVTGNPYLKQSIFFNHASKKLSAADRRDLAALAKKINDGTLKLVRVVGHASKRTLTKNSVAQDVVNYRVSLARAGAVTKMLLESGLPAEWLEVTGYGDTLPTTDVVGKAEEAANRRVDVLVYHAK